MTNEKPLSRIRHWLLSGVTVLLTLTVGIITGVFAVIVNLATDLIPKSWPIVSNAYLLGGIGLCFIVLTAAIERVRRNLSNSQSGEGTKRSNSETLSAAFIGRDNSGTVIQAAGGTVNYYGSVASNRIPDQNNDDQRSSLSLVATQSRLPRSSAHFVGRDHELKELEKALLGNRGAVVAIHGLGGVGKTQLALKYANNHLGSYKDIWWIPCDSAPLIVEGLSVIGPELGVPKDVEPQLVVDLVLAELCQLNNWLIIYDNAQSLDELNQFIPAQSGNVIVTSRARGFGALGVSLEVRELSRAESVDFFRRRISIEAANGSLNELSRLLGNLPLALAQVAAYIEVTGISVDS